MIEPSPNINKAYVVLVKREGQRSIASTSTSGEGTMLASLMALEKCEFLTCEWKKH